MNKSVADIVSKQLQIQIVRIQSHIGVASQFPDWEPVTDHVQSVGQCIKYVGAQDALQRSSCVGSDHGVEELPNWLVAFGSRLLGESLNISQPIFYREKFYGTLYVSIDSRVAIASIWRQLSGLLGLTALVVVAICVLVYIAIAQALRPTKHILDGLERLGRGDLSCRLPNFQLIELQRISEVFNTLVANLNETTRERTALAARLADGMEQERLHLARELHDDLAQALSALNAMAASIEKTAENECPSLVPEAASLVQTSMSVMKSLRSTLRHLRPPEIDDFGLVASLAALAREQERSTNGSIELQIAEDIQDLSPTAAAHIYRIVQEGLNNIAKHACGSQAHIALAFVEDRQRFPRWLEVTIENDGRSTNLMPRSDERGLGLIGIQERVMALGGKLKVTDRGQNGFRLHATIPQTETRADP